MEALSGVIEYLRYHGYDALEGEAEVARFARWSDSSLVDIRVHAGSRILVRTERIGRDCLVVVSSCRATELLGTVVRQVSLLDRI